MVGVAVETNVGVSDCVGVNVGGSGVNVAVGVASNVGNKVFCGAFCVSPAITVCATAVLMIPVSGVVIPGAAQAILAINNTAAGK